MPSIVGWCCGFAAFLIFTDLVIPTGQHCPVPEEGELQSGYDGDTFNRRVCRGFVDESLGELFAFACIFDIFKYYLQLLTMNLPLKQSLTSSTEAKRHEYDDGKAQRIQWW